MFTSRKLTHSFLLASLTLLSLTAATRAADPGIPYSADGIVSDQKPGSVLVYNFYSSSASSPTTENTRFNLTNTSSARAVAVHLFFVDGSSCSVAAINFNPAAGSSAGAFAQGHNLHKLRLSPSSSLLIPVFPPLCST